MDDHELVARILRERVEHLPDDVAEKICFEVSDEILAALAKAGRLAPEVKGDVLLKAYDEAVEVYAGISGEIESDALHAAVVAASGIVAADAERRVRAECIAALMNMLLKPTGPLFDREISQINRCIEVLKGLPHAD